MAARKNVPAAVVRDWARSESGTKALADAGAPQVGSRGRIHADTLAVFHKENPRKRYEQASEAEKPSVTFKATVLDKAGRKTTREVTITTEQARALLGHPAGKVGRLPMDDLRAAYEADYAQQVADTFTLAA